MSVLEFTGEVADTYGDCDSPTIDGKTAEPRPAATGDSSRASCMRRMYQSAFGDPDSLF